MCSTYFGHQSSMTYLHCIIFSKGGRMIEYISNSSPFITLSIFIILYSLWNRCQKTHEQYCLLFHDIFSKFKDEIYKNKQYRSSHISEYKYIDCYRKSATFHPEEYLNECELEHQHESKKYSDLFLEMKKHKIYIWIKIFVLLDRSEVKIFKHSFYTNQVRFF